MSPAQIHRPNGFRLLGLASRPIVAAKLDIASRLTAGPKTVAELAAECGAKPVPSIGLLRALASFRACLPRWKRQTVSS